MIISEALSNIKVFQNLPVTTREAIAQHCKLRKVSNQHCIIDFTKPSTEVYFLLEGRVRATMYTPSGGEVSYQDLGPGDMFGELAAIDKQKRTTNVVALEDSVLIWLSSPDFHELLSAHPGFALAVLKKITALNRFLCERIYEFSALDVKRRVRAELVRLAESQGEQGEGQSIIVNAPPKHQELANRLATHREAVTRELNVLEKTHIITKGRNQLIICDIERLNTMIWDE